MSKTAFDSIAKFIGQYDKKLIAQALNGLDFVKDVRTINNASLNGTLLPKMTVAKGIRNLDLNVSSRSGEQRNWSGRKLLIYGGMKIINIIPEEAMNTFQSDMLVPGAKEIPFAQWVWEQEFKKISTEINDSIYLSTYKGDASVLDTGSGYTAGDYVKFGSEYDVYKCVTNATAGQTPTTHPAKWSKVNESIISEGWGTIIAAEISGGGLTNVITTGTPSASNAVDKVELMIQGMTQAHRKLGGCILMSSTQYSNYLLAERAKYNYVATPQMGIGKKTVYGYPNWEICEATWMGSSNRYIATQQNNLVFGTNMVADLNSAGKIIQTLHGYDTVVKWHQGCQVSDLETLYVNDQA
jgi:hypothetical protein